MRRVEGCIGDVLARLFLEETAKGLNKVRRRCLYEVRESKLELEFAIVGESVECILDRALPRGCCATRAGILHAAKYASAALPPAQDKATSLLQRFAEPSSTDRLRTPLNRCSEREGRGSRKGSSPERIADDRCRPLSRRGSPQALPCMRERHEVVAAGHFSVVLLYPELEARLPRTRVTEAVARIVYRDDPGILRSALARATVVGFGVSGVHTRQDDDELVALTPSR